MIIPRIVRTLVKPAAWSSCNPSLKTPHFSGKRTRRLRRTSAFYFQCALLAAGWFLTVRYYHQTYTNRRLIQVWNPYHILGVSSRSSISQIKRGYKLRCISSHPDKRKTSGKAEAEAAFIELTKAYKVLTDPVTKENFKKFGHPDGNQKVVVGLAIPKFLGDTKWGRHGVLLGWFVILTLILPCCMGAWRTCFAFRSVGGISLQDLYHLFLTDKQNFGLNPDNLINTFSKCQEVTRVVQESGLLKIRSSNHLRKSLEDTKCSQIAKILIFAHIRRQYLPSPFEELKEDLVVVYIKLAVCLLKLVSQTKQLPEVKAVILLLQRLRQGSQPNDTPSSQLFTWGHRHYVPNERVIQTNCKALLTFNALVRDAKTSSPPAAMIAEVENSEEDGDLETLWRQRTRRVHPQVPFSLEMLEDITSFQNCTYMFLIYQSSESRLLTYPRLSTIPHETFGCPPKQLRFSFETPTIPQRLHLVLQGLNMADETANYYLHISVDVHPRAHTPVQITEAKKNISVMSIKAFNENTGMDLSKTDLHELKFLHGELKKIVNEELQLSLKGIDKNPELLASRKFIQSEIDKLARKMKSSKGTSSQPTMTVNSGDVGPQTVKTSKESGWTRRVALKRLALRGMEVPIPEALKDDLWVTSVEMGSRDLDEETERDEVNS